MAGIDVASGPSFTGVNWIVTHREIGLDVEHVTVTSLVRVFPRGVDP